MERTPPELHSPGQIYKLHANSIKKHYKNQLQITLWEKCFTPYLAYQKQEPPQTDAADTCLY